MLQNNWDFTGFSVRP